MKMLTSAGEWTADSFCGCLTFHYQTCPTYRNPPSKITQDEQGQVHRHGPYTPHQVFERTGTRAQTPNRFECRDGTSITLLLVLGVVMSLRASRSTVFHQRRQQPASTCPAPWQADDRLAIDEGL